MESENTKSKSTGKSRRKISMPWFRQSSFGMSLSRLRLPKQHTIATPDHALPDDDDDDLNNDNWQDGQGKTNRISWNVR